MDETELQQQAQRAAELRLMTAVDMLINEDDEWITEWDDLAGPFCGCGTCVVREVLDAAWPYIYELALRRIENRGA